MQDHEQSLVDALARLADLSDGESGTSRFSISPLIETLINFVTYYLVFLVALITYGVGITWSTPPQKCCSDCFTKQWLD
jgi:hypothetical protein